MDHKKKTSRQLQAEETRKRILDAAIELLDEHALDDITIQQICSRADVSVGAYYHYFNGKEGVIQEAVVIQIYGDCDEFFHNEVIPRFENRTDTDSIIEYLLCQVDYAMNKPISMVQGCYKAQINYGNIFFLSQERALPQGLFTLIERVQNAGNLTCRMDALEICRDLLVLTRGIIYSWCVSTGQLDMEQSVRRIAGNYLNSIKVSQSAGL